MTDVNTKATKASITAGTAGTSSATSGASLSVPYVTVNTEGIVTGYGTHTHTISGFITDSEYAERNITGYYELSSNQGAIAPNLARDGVGTFIIKNTGSSSITISFPTTGYIFVDGNDSMEIPSGKYGEISCLRITSNNTTRYFVRSAVQS